jgi:hypothetical protein
MALDQIEEYGEVDDDQLQEICQRHFDA